VSRSTEYRRDQPPAIKTLPLARSVAVCPERGVVISPVAVNVPGDCGIAIEAWHGTPSRRIGRTILVLIATL
jgi:hypothetical protein